MQLGKNWTLLKKIRNEFAHRIARSFSYEKIRDLTDNLVIAERMEFHMSVELLEPGANGVLWLGDKPPPGTKSVPVLPAITQDKLVPRERYIRACQFYTGALLFVAHSQPRQSFNIFF